MTIKDTFDVEHMAASSGMKAYIGRVVGDAAAVARTRYAGAVIWGKTNVPVMAADWQSYNALYGTTNNPWDLERTPGGSSGGAAAVVAAGITPLEIGSDIGGSLRVPASFCGVFSHKPTWGLVPQRGQVPPQPGAYAERDLNVAGPIARSARDLRLLLSILVNGPIAAKAPSADLNGLKVGLWVEDPDFALDAEVRAVIEAFAAALGARGAEVKPVHPAKGVELIPAYSVLLGSIVAQDMAPGTRRSLKRMRAVSDLLGGFAGSPPAWSRAIRGYTATHAEWLEADEVRARIAYKMKTVFEHFDVVLAPVAPIVAFPHDHKPFGSRKLVCSDSRTIPYGSMLNWIALATACGLPVTTVPAGRATSGLPVGVQIIGPHGGDARTLAVAQAVEEDICGFVAPPPLGAV
jgi:amidase